MAVLRSDAAVLEGLLSAAASLIVEFANDKIYRISRCHVRSIFVMILDSFSYAGVGIK